MILKKRHLLFLIIPSIFIVSKMSFIKESCSSAEKIGLLITDLKSLLLSIKEESDISWVSISLIKLLFFIRESLSDIAWMKSLCYHHLIKILKISFGDIIYKLSLLFNSL